MNSDSPVPRPENDWPRSASGLLLLDRVTLPGLASDGTGWEGLTQHPGLRREERTGLSLEQKLLQGRGFVCFVL